MLDFEINSWRRMAVEAEKIAKDCHAMADQWEQMEKQARNDETMRITRSVRTLARLLRNVRNGMA